MRRINVRALTTSLMNDMTSSNISTCTVSYNDLPRYTHLHFLTHTVLEIQFQQTFLLAFFVFLKQLKNVLYLHTFFKESLVGMYLACTMICLTSYPDLFLLSLTFILEHRLSEYHLPVSLRN